MRIGSVSFGSTYAIKYDYTRNTEAKGSNDRPYISETATVDEFIRKIDRDYKGKNDVSSFNPEKKLYFLNVKAKRKKDTALESLARAFGIEMKKVNSKEMKGTQIVSVGRNQEGRDGELKGISSLITSYKEKENYKRQLENQEENFRFAMQGMQDRHDFELRLARGFDVCELPDD